MNKIIKALMVGLVLTMLASCSDNEGQPFDEPEVNSATLCYVTVPDTAKTLTAERAIMIAARHSGTGADSRTAGRLPASIDAVNDEDGNPLMYVVNYTDNKGFVILSASKEYYPILAESDEGSFDLRNLEPEHPVNLWLDEQKFLVEHIDALPDSVKSRAASLWMEYNYDRAAISAAIDSRANYPEKPQVYYDSLRRWTLDPNIEVYTYEDYINTEEYSHLSDEVKRDIKSSIHYLGNSQYGTVESSTLVLRKSLYKEFRNQLIQTKWAQGEPYNGMIPGKKLGCTTVAVGQIMKYHKFPVYFAWDNMPNIGATIVTQSFLYELGKEINGGDFGSKKTGASIGEVKSALKKYGYRVSEHSHNPNSVSSQLSLGKGFPVCMFGDNRAGDGSHAWVCDGIDTRSSHIEIRFMTLEYRPTTVSIPPMIEAYKIMNLEWTYTKFHYIWGANGDFDAFFYDSDISFTDGKGDVKDYSKNRKDVHVSPNYQ
ncbi:MAG: C10 family peptidase [Candidatus Amulumruptor sp.]|nr:C10 family peptidase [Candidatus Amulumruptor sp.]